MNKLPGCIENAVTGRRLIAPGEKILVAVSGGLDSMVLLHILARLGPKNGWRLTVAHFNHRLRGWSSDADERLVEITARKLGLPFVAGQGSVREFSKAHGVSIEMAARELRHGFLAKTARKRGIRTIALAHHADDQVELFWLRLLRGAGGTGLGGMKWKSPSPGNSEIALVRPLLGETKAVLGDWATREKIEYREDATNAQVDYLRNRIRHELLPTFAKRFQPAISRVTLRQMEILGAESEFVKATAEQWLARKKGGRFAALPTALQRQCLQIQLARLGLPVSFDLVERLREGANCQVTVGPGVWVSRDVVGRIHAGKAPAVHRRVTRVPLRGGAGEVSFGGCAFEWELKSVEPEMRGVIPKKAVNLERFDADKVGRVVVLRHWRPGDRFQPIGMERPVKLQNLFVNSKIARAHRQELVVAATAGGEIFWVEGLRIGERCKLNKSTRRVLKWGWKRL